MGPLGVALLWKEGASPRIPNAPCRGPGYQPFTSGKDGVNPAAIADCDGAFVLAGSPLAFSILLQVCSISLSFPD